MLAPQTKHSLHKSWCGQADVGLPIMGSGLSATPLCFLTKS